MATAMCCRDIQMEASFEQSILRVHCGGGEGGGAEGWIGGRRGGEGPAR